jgi:hypothetical protein
MQLSPRLGQVRTRGNKQRWEFQCVIWAPFSKVRAVTQGAGNAPLAN